MTDRYARLVAYQFERLKAQESVLIEAGEAVVKCLINSKTRDERKKWGQILQRINVVLKAQQ